MNWMRRINPVNHLFGRLFLWFWFTLLLTLTVTAMVTRQFNDSPQIKPLSQKHLQWLQTKQEAIAALINNSRSRRDIRDALGRIGMRTNTHPVLYRLEDKRIISAMPEREFRGSAAFEQAVEFQRPVTVSFSRWRFYGPTSLVLDNQQYALFIGRMLPPDRWRDLRQQYPWLLLILALSLSALPCLLLARSLVKPLKSLQKHARQMGAGNLSHQDVATAKRRDEFGQLATEFNLMAHRVEDMLERQQRILSDISHELRTPLTRMQLAIALAEQQFGEGSLVLKRIEKEAGLIDTMLNQLLTLARLDNQHSKNFSDFGLNELLEPVMQDARFEAQSIGKEIALHGESAFTLHGDIRLLASALENVLRNAIKYADRIIHVTLHQQTNHLVIDIADDGKGVDSHQLGKLFSPFYRTSDARDRDSGGVGLGLAIASRAIHAHGGEIKANNGPAGGLVVTVELPLTQSD